MRVAKGGTEESDKNAELLQYLLFAKQKRPRNTQTYPYLVQHYGVDDISAGYESIGEWMSQDKLRRELLVMRKVFNL